MNKDQIYVKFIDGIINPCQDKPGNVNSRTITEGRIRVSRNKIVTLINQFPIPKVKKFIGMNRIFNIGLTINIKPLRTNPAVSILPSPPEICKPPYSSLTNQRAKTLNIYNLSKYFIGKW